MLYIIHRSLYCISLFTSITTDFLLAIEFVEYILIFVSLTVLPKCRQPESKSYVQKTGMLLKMMTCIKHAKIIIPLSRTM